MLVLHTNPVEVEIFSYVNAFFSSKKSGAPNENIVQNHLNIALLNVF